MGEERSTRSLRFQILVSFSLLVVTAILLLGLLVGRLAQAFFANERRTLGLAAAGLAQRALSQNLSDAGEGREALVGGIERALLPLATLGAFHSLTLFDLGDEPFWSTLPAERRTYLRVYGLDLERPVLAMQSWTRTDPATGQEMMAVAFPVKIKSEMIGYGLVVLPIVTEEHRFLLSFRLILLFALAYGAVVVLVGMTLLSQLVLKPLYRVNTALDRVRAGEREVELPMEGPQEIHLLAERFNAMLRSLRENEDRMSEQIEELLRVNEELELARRGLIRSAKLASVGRLAAGVAHEVGNPLSAILGYVDLLRRGDIDPEMEKDFLDRIERDTQRIHAIIRSLLDYSRPQKEKVERLDANRLIGETIDLLSVQRQFRHVQFDVKSHLEPAFIRADRHHLQQVLVNLFLNAGQAMNEEGTISLFLERVTFDPRLTFRQAAGKFRPGQSLVSLSVIDQGCGMTEEVKARVFDPFFTTKEIGQGTGLGLSVSDKIVDGLGGTIEVESLPGEGATFTILLPEDVEGEGASDGE